MKFQETCARKATGVFGDLRNGERFYINIGGNQWSVEVCEKVGPFDYKCNGQAKVASFWTKVEKVS